MDLVYIKWADSKGCHADWQDIEDFKGSPTGVIVKTVGFVIRESDTVIHVAPHIFFEADEVNQFCGDMEILKTAIISMVVLNPEEEPIRIVK